MTTSREFTQENSVYQTTKSSQIGYKNTSLSSIDKKKKIRNQTPATEKKTDEPTNAQSPHKHYNLNTDRHTATITNTELATFTDTPDMTAGFGRPLT